MLRHKRCSLLLKSILAVVITLGFIIALIPSKTFVSDTLYNSGLVHSEPIVCQDCFQYTPIYSLDPGNFICSGGAFLVVLVASRPSNASHRHAIRETWGGRRLVRGVRVRVVFLTGLINDNTTQEHLQAESLKHRDIVQADFFDSYRNLTYKSIMGLQWAMKSCSRAKFLLKTDDDTFVNIERIVAYLRNLNPNQDFIGGNCFTSRPIRDPSSKWYVRPNEYTESYYPMYCNGFSYVMPMHTAAKLVSVQPNIPFIYIEDVYITGMCRNALRIPYRNLPSYLPDVVYVRRACDWVYFVSTAHYVNESMLYSLHHMMSDQGFIQDCLDRASFTVHPMMLIFGGVVLLSAIFYLVMRRSGMTARWYNFKSNNNNNNNSSNGNGCSNGGEMYRKYQIS